MSGNFIPMVYAVLKDKGIDTKGMSTNEAIEKYNELVGKSGKYDTESGEKKIETNNNDLTKNINGGIIINEERAALLANLRNGKLSIEDLEVNPIFIEANNRSEANCLKGYTNNINTREREALRDGIAKTLSERGSYNPETGVCDGKVKSEKMAVIVIGLPAAGKSQKIVEPLSTKFGMRIVDADDAKKMLPEFDGGYGADRVHEESSKLIADSRLTDLATRNGDNVIFPILGKKYNRIEERRQYLEGRGYNVYLAHNEVKNETSVRRAAGRFVEKNRYLPLDMIREIGDKPSETYRAAKIASNFKGYLHINNDVPFGQEPIIKEDTEGFFK